MRNENAFPAVNLLADRRRALGERRPSLRLPFVVALVAATCLLILFLALQIVALRQ